MSVDGELRRTWVRGQGDGNQVREWRKGQATPSGASDGEEAGGLRTAQPEHNVRSLGTLARAVSGKHWEQKSHGFKKEQDRNGRG